MPRLRRPRDRKISRQLLLLLLPPSFAPRNRHVGNFSRLSMRRRPHKTRRSTLYSMHRPLLHLPPCVRPLLPRELSRRTGNHSNKKENLQCHLLRACNMLKTLRPPSLGRPRALSNKKHVARTLRRRRAAFLRKDPHRALLRPRGIRHPPRSNLPLPIIAPRSVRWRFRRTCSTRSSPIDTLRPLSWGVCFFLRAAKSGVR